MKYIILLCDGMSDYKIPELNNKTPLGFAQKPEIDSLALSGEVGLCKTIPNGLKPGSDIANLSVLGYNPFKDYTGRSPLEAVSMGIKLESTDITLRCNLVTLSGEDIYEEKHMVDYSADEISSEESKTLIDFIGNKLNSPKYKFYPGVSYRHCLVVKESKLYNNLTPPHDITDKQITSYLPEDKELLDLMKKSSKLLAAHPVNLRRILAGKNPANSIWLWGDGTKPVLPSFKEKYKLKACVISAVDLVKGIGMLAGMKVINVKGATGNIDTNYKGKALAALDELKRADFIYLHVEAPDECGHKGDYAGKIKAIENIDKNIVKTLITGLNTMKSEYSILICPDHSTPCAVKTHTNDLVPYLIYRSTSQVGTNCEYDEESAKRSGIVLEGEQLINRLLSEK